MERQAEREEAERGGGFEEGGECEAVWSEGGEGVEGGGESEEYFTVEALAGEAADGGV